MLFFGPLYNWLAAHYAMQINHFALVKLILTALDKTIFYFLVFAFFRLLWLFGVRHRRSLASEVSVWLFVFYMLLVFMGTTFRDAYFPWQIELHLHRPLSDINLIFLKETWKMIYAPSHLDFYYNSLGNVLCFVPFGLLFPLVFSKKATAAKTILLGMGWSITIEICQFFLATGVTDIDDVFFNTIGASCGYLLYRLFKRVKKEIS